MRTEAARLPPRRGRGLAAWIVALGLAAGLGGFGPSPQPHAAEGAPRFDFPLACTPGADCWIFQYFDHDPGPGWRDYACGRRSYDGHTGTDIALRTVAAIERGPPVLAAAAGVVRAVRDGMPDRLYDAAHPETVRNRECGNGVAITHGDAWETQYCHLRKGSVRVRPGQHVAAGAVLGQIGLSGRTQFPHLEFSVRHDGKPVDPFTGEQPFSACERGAGHLWTDRALARTAYSPVDILAAGFAGRVPQPAEAYAGRLTDKVLPADAPALVGWTTLAAVRRGDRLAIRLIAPDGSPIAENSHEIDQDKIRYFAYAGRRRRDDPWPEGAYRLEIRLTRPDGGIVREDVRTLTVR